MQMRKSTLKKKLKRWRVDEAERYTEAVPDGRNNSKGSSYTRVAAWGTCRVCKKTARKEKGVGEVGVTYIAETNHCFGEQEGSLKG